MCGNSSHSKSEGSYYPQGNSISRHLDPILYRIVYTLCLLNLVLKIKEKSNRKVIMRKQKSFKSIL